MAWKLCHFESRANFFYFFHYTELKFVRLKPIEYVERKQTKEIKMSDINKIKEELLEAEERTILDNIDCYEWLIEHTLEDHEQILDNFIRNYKTTNTHSIIQFGDYESSEAEYIISKLGVENTVQLILENLYIKQDYDLYHEHWNDIGSADWSEYEVQIDLDEDHPNFKDFQAAEPDGTSNYISFFGCVDLGMIRYKLDTEQFEKQLFQQYLLDVNSLIDLPETKEA